jgi:hypothetical protein
MVEVLKKDFFLHGPFLVSKEVVFECFWINIVKELQGLIFFGLSIFFGFCTKFIW